MRPAQPQSSPPRVREATPAFRRLRLRAALVALFAAAIGWRVAVASADEWPGEHASAEASSSVEAGASAPADAGASPEEAGTTSAVDTGAAPQAPEAGAATLPTPEAGPPPAAFDAGAKPAAAGVPASKPPAPDGGSLPWDDRLSFGIRAEYAFPVGSISAGASISDSVAGAFLIGGEIGYLVAPRLTLLGYFFYGFPQVPAGGYCASNPDDDCSAGLYRFGVVANYHFAAEKRFDPWVGLGLGYELLTLTATDDTTGDQDFAQSLNGLEVNALGGVEWRPGKSFGIGPYANVSAGHFFAEGSGAAIHSWLGIGLRIRTGQ